MMGKYVVLSVNDNPDYLYYTPLTCWAWRKFGWEPIVMYNGSHDGLFILDKAGAKFEIQQVNDIPGYRSDTITQVSRLYAACTLNQQAYLMTGDIDMIPLSDYWKFNDNEITVWGHDLTGHTHYPICYIGMPMHLWGHVMNLESTDYNALIKRDLDSMPNAKESADWEKRWFTDQDLVTKRLDGFHINSVLRGQHSNGYAIGRMDRGSWHYNHATFTDAHLFQQVYHKGREQYFDKTMELLTSIWPEEDFGWFLAYTQEFRKLTGHA